MTNGRGSATTTIIAELSSISSNIIMMLMITRKSMLSRIIVGINDRLVLIQELIDRHIIITTITTTTIITIMSLQIDLRGTTTTIMIGLEGTWNLNDNKSIIIATLSKATMVAASAAINQRIIVIIRT